MCLLTVVAVAAVWVDAEIQNTDRYVETVAPLASNAAIQDAVTLAIMNRLQGVDLSAAIRQAALSAREDVVASLVTSMYAYIESTVRQVVTSARFSTLWTEANRTIHAEVAALLTGKETTLVSATDDDVSIDLAPVLAAVADQLDANGITYFDDTLAKVTGTELVLFDASKLRSAQELAHLLHRLARLLPVLALVLFALTLALAGRRRAALRRTGIAIAITMALLLVVLSLVRSWQADQLAAIDRPAALAFFDVLLVRLRDSVRILLIFGALLAVAATLLHHGTWRWLTNRLRSLLAAVIERLPAVLLGISVLAFIVLGSSSRRESSWVTAMALAALATGAAGFILQRVRAKRPPGVERVREGEA
jgi:hypothetical protein